MNNFKKYLASANSTQGFVNKFCYINPEKNSFTYILKGGPGTGKSTLMKRVGKYFEDKKFFVEYFYCSSDSDSLDGVRIKNFSIVDGTAPHVTEASIPQVKEKIVNVGEFIGENVKKHKFEIEKYLKIKANCFKMAYLYFFSLEKLFEEEILELNTNKNLEKFDLITKGLKNLDKKGTHRELFSSYITKDGYKSLYKQNSYKNVIVLSGNFVENEKLFLKLTEFLKAKNTSFISFLSIFNPKMCEAVYINKLDTLIVSENSYNESFVNFKNKFLIQKIVKKIAQNLFRAKFNHKKVEEFYIKNMDFAGLNKQEEKIIKEIEKNIK